MTTDSRSTQQQPVRPIYPQRSRVETAVIAVVAAVISSTLLGGTLSLSELRSEQGSGTMFVALTPLP